MRSCVLDWRRSAKIDEENVAPHRMSMLELAEALGNVSEAYHWRGMCQKRILAGAAVALQQPSGVSTHSFRPTLYVVVAIEFKPLHNEEGRDDFAPFDSVKPVRRLGVDATTS